MGPLQRQSTNKAKRTFRDIVEYAQEVVQDERLRADVGAALAHGSKASEQLKKDIEAGGIHSKLAADKKILKNLRAMLHDLDAASNRVRRKKSHRIRNVAPMLSGLERQPAPAVPKIRPWLAERRETFGTESTEPDLVT